MDAGGAVGADWQENVEVEEVKGAEVERDNSNAASCG